MCRRNVAQEFTLLGRLPLASGCWRTRHGITPNCILTLKDNTRLGLRGGFHREAAVGAGWAVVWGKGCMMVAKAEVRWAAVP
jgi:hypothetical protein